MQRAVAYIRVSDPKQVTDGNSLVTQESQTRAYVRTKGYTLERLFVEPGESAKTDNRPVLKEMLAYCRANRGRVEVVVIPKIDRLARQIYDYIGLKTQLQKLGIRLESIGERLEDSPVGRFTENILASVAQFDNEIRAERSKGGMVQAVKEGRWVWRAPKGYRNTRFNGKVNIEPDPETAPLVAETFTRLASGTYQVREVREWLASKGMPMSRSYFHRLMTNRLYLGEITVFGETTQASPPFIPLVSRQAFAAARLALAPRQLPKTYERDNPAFPLRGTIRCKCGRFLNAAWSKGRHRRYPYYLCTRCPKTNHRREAVERSFLRLLGLVKPVPSLFKPLRKAIRVHWREVIEETADKKRRIAAELDRARDLQKAIALKNASGIIPDTIAKGQIDDLGDRILELEACYPAGTASYANPDSVLDFVERFLSRLSDLWLLADASAKKRLQRLLFPDGVQYGPEAGFRTGKEGPFAGLCRLFEPELSSVVHHMSRKRNPSARTKRVRNKRIVSNQKLINQARDVAQEAWELFRDLYEKADPDQDSADQGRCQ